MTEYEEFDMMTHRLKEKSAFDVDAAHIHVCYNVNFICCCFFYVFLFVLYYQINYIYIFQTEEGAKCCCQSHKHVIMSEVVFQGPNL